MSYPDNVSPKDFDEKRIDRDETHWALLRLEAKFIDGHRNNSKRNELVNLLKLMDAIDDGKSDDYIYNLACELKLESHIIWR